MSRYEQLCRATGAQLQSLARPTLRSLQEQPAFARLLTAARQGPVQPETVLSWLDRDLIHSLLRGALLNLVEFEYLFTALRSAYLQRLPEASADDLPNRRLKVSLALQCFGNDHAWFESDSDLEKLAPLTATVEDGKAGEDELIVYAMFRPLAALDAHLLEPLRSSDCAHLKALLKEAYDIPHREKQLQQQLRAVGQVQDPTSLKVQQQYESNPYPRWWSQPEVEPCPLVETLAGWYPQLAEAGLKSEEVLVAGCGNGRHPIILARNWPESQITGIDLSRPSLACCVRLADELEVPNVRFFQADLLTLSEHDGWRDRFQLIDSVGVLHHMQKPVEGCRSLRRLLVKGGILRVGLYSRVARAYRGIDEARALCPTELADPTHANLRRARRALLETPMAQFMDFHSLSGFRDLAAPAHEVLFTPTEAAQMLTEAGLSEVKLLASPGLQKAFVEDFPQASQDDFEAWDRFEQAHPDMFSQMLILSGRRL